MFFWVSSKRTLKQKRASSTIEVEEFTRQKLLQLKKESKKKILEDGEKLWVARTFGLEQFITKVYLETGIQYLVIISDWQIIDLAEKKLDDSSGDFALRRCY